MRLAFFGGIYNNYLALQAAIEYTRNCAVDEVYCLGDLGAFGPHPERVFDLIHQERVTCIQGNYDHSIGNNLDDCQCGYTDHRDNHFAKISYDYSHRHTSPANRDWMRDLPDSLRIEHDGLRFLLCHGSPRKTNEFLWESTSSTHFLNKLADDYQADILLATHTGIHWQRDLSRGRRFVNVGVLGRPENDGKTNVWFALISTGQDAHSSSTKSGQRNAKTSCHVEFVPLTYDHQRLAREMREEKIPEEFVETVLTGWWTTCLEILPAKERRRGRH